ncbi:MAG: transcriptional regulator GutM [Nocardioides sp.]
MTMLTVLIAAVVAGWVVQLVLAYRQSMAFNDAVRALRTRGTVSVGVAGRRYRGGRQYVAIVADPQGRVHQGITLRGFTTFARPRPLPALFDSRVSVLCGPSEIPHLSRQQREAARQAATLWKAGAGTGVRATVP